MVCQPSRTVHTRVNPPPTCFLLSKNIPATANIPVYNFSRREVERFMHTCEVLSNIQGVQAPVSLC